MTDSPGFEVRVDTRAVIDRTLATEIAALARERAAGGGQLVLGLASGQTPLGVYQELVRLARDGALDPRVLVTFNLDEYYGLEPDNPSSFREWMRRTLFDPLPLNNGRIHFPVGDIARDRVADWCADYERSIRAAGGIDVQLLGLGLNGHIGFNEPGSPSDSRTRLVRLTGVTRQANAAAFAHGEAVPEEAITMGIGTILEARRIRIIAYGAHKASVAARLVRSPIGPAVPASLVRQHPDAVLYLSPAAAAELD